ncbi:hypothetical protein SUGI_0662710 [Cryptomeria japonica]|nr:hypothetical protein SUGI_0662710 [Cryptomeria japonica]
MAYDYDRSEDYLFKIVLTGVSVVGKSNFHLNLKPTIRRKQWNQRQMEIDDKEIKSQIWSTKGHERFRAVTSTYCRGAEILDYFDLIWR